MENFIISHHNKLETAYLNKIRIDEEMHDFVTFDAIADLLKFSHGLGKRENSTIKDGVYIREIMLDDIQQVLIIIKLGVPHIYTYQCELYKIDSSFDKSLIIECIEKFFGQTYKFTISSMYWKDTVDVEDYNRYIKS